MREAGGDMIERRKIFIGSSSEAEEQGMVEAIAAIIHRAGMEPIVWKEIFPAGEILLETIEQLPDTVDGAVLLVTPNLDCKRKARNKEFSAPVANVVFEYGYLSGRLSRRRVAICMFEGAEMPSDLKGLTIVRAGSYNRSKHLSQLPDAEPSLQRWLTTLVPLPVGIPAMRRVHGYSGIWEVQNTFEIWHGITVTMPDSVSWDGKTLLRISDDGQKGYGSQIGHLKVKFGQYQATWQVANEVTRAAVDKDGSLTMRVEVRARSLLGKPTGKPPSERVYEELPSPGWDLYLDPVPNKPRKLEGYHDYKVGGSIYSYAREYYAYADV
jgi:hypothetical protein